MCWNKDVASFPCDTQRDRRHETNANWKSVKNWLCDYSGGVPTVICHSNCGRRSKIVCQSGKIIFTNLLAHNFPSTISHSLKKIMASWRWPLEYHHSPSLLTNVVHSHHLSAVQLLGRLFCHISYKSLRNNRGGKSILITFCSEKLNGLGHYFDFLDIWWYAVLKTEAPKEILVKGTYN